MSFPDHDKVPCRDKVEETGCVFVTVPALGCGGGEAAVAEAALIPCTVKEQRGRTKAYATCPSLSFSPGPALEMVLPTRVLSSCLSLPT